MLGVAKCQTLDIDGTDISGGHLTAFLRWEIWCAVYVQAVRAGWKGVCNESKWGLGRGV